MKEANYQFVSEDFHKAYRVLYLIKIYMQKKLSAKEREELDVWLEESDKNIELFEDLIDEPNVDGTLELYEQMREEDALRRVKNRIPFVQPKHKSRFSILSVSIAASVLLIAGIAGFIYFKQADDRSKEIVANGKPIQQQIADVLPAGNKAILTLGNGKQLVLDSASNGSLVIEGNTQVMKENTGLSYNLKQQVGIAQQPVMNILTTPKGGQYQVTLSDGTKVWLNAASSLKYPTAFTGKERVVELTGEGYFDVAHGTQPFKVKLDGCEVEDLGTVFNINTYKDEGFIKAALIQGAIRVTKNGISKTLAPGQEAQINEGIKVNKIDLEALTGWRNEKFVYSFTPMKSVLLDLERWYNISIQNKDVNHHHLKATIDRNISLAKMIRILEGSGEIRFQIKGSELIVLP